jgi:hypothetical protein
LHHDRGGKNFRKGRKPGCSFGDITRSCQHCFEGSTARANVTMVLWQIMTVCRELRIREGRVGMTATCKRGPRCSQPPIGGPIKQMYVCMYPCMYGLVEISVDPILLRVRHVSQPIHHFGVLIVSKPICPRSPPTWECRFWSRRNPTEQELRHPLHDVEIRCLLLPRMSLQTNT